MAALWSYHPNEITNSSTAPAHFAVVGSLVPAWLWRLAERFDFLLGWLFPVRNQCP